MAKSDFQVALNNCEREPVRWIGAIQPFAYLLSFDPDSLRVVHWSQNLNRTIEFLKSEESLVCLRRVFANRELVHSIRGSLGLPSIRSVRERIGQYRFRGEQVEVAIYLVDDLAVVELEPCDESIERPSSSVARVKSMLSALNDPNLDVEGQEFRPGTQSTLGQDRLLRAGVDILRKLTGFDRVMGYRFLDDGCGEVAAESVAPGLIPFEGLRYPAYDIPPQVREIALRSHIRVIADIHAESVGIAGSEEPLDMALCQSRAVSPIHVEYLTNMGVRATMNLSIVVRGKLWGLFAFHHERPKLLSPSYRAVAELFAEFFSMQLQQEIEKQILSKRRRADSLRESIKNADISLSPAQKLLLAADALQAIFEAHGVAFCHHGEWHTAGHTPNALAMDFLRQNLPAEVVSLDSLVAFKDLSTSEASWESSGGVLVARIDEETQLFLFRDEVIHEVKWGGMPKKEIEQGSFGPRLHPRSSFNEYVESVAGRCTPWTQAELSALADLRSAVVDMLYQDEKRSIGEAVKQRQYQDLLIAELNHRVKNILSLVSSLAEQSKISSRSLEDYTVSFGSRIASLISAHDLIGGSGSQWVGLERMLRAEISPHLNDGLHIDLQGPHVSVRSDAAPTIALVLHELTTNAAKHGALVSGTSGKLEVHWMVDSGGVRLHWSEQCEQNVPASTDRGFGMSLIERAIPYECNGEADVELRSDGLHAKFWIPSDLVSHVPTERVAKPIDSERPKGGNVELPAVVLLVEDNMIIAMEMERNLRDIGCQCVETVGNVADAQALLPRVQIDFAILDIDLQGEASFPIAFDLCKMQVPFVFATGYDSSFPIPESLRDARTLNKPVRRSDLQAVILNWQESR